MLEHARAPLAAEGEQPPTAEGPAADEPAPSADVSRGDDEFGDFGDFNAFDETSDAPTKSDQLVPEGEATPEEPPAIAMDDDEFGDFGDFDAFEEAPPANDPASMQAEVPASETAREEDDDDGFGDFGDFNYQMSE